MLSASCPKYWPHKEECFGVCIGWAFPSWFRKMQEGNEECSDSSLNGSGQAFSITLLCQKWELGEIHPTWLRPLDWLLTFFQSSFLNHKRPMKKMISSSYASRVFASVTQVLNCFSNLLFTNYLMRYFFKLDQLRFLEAKLFKTFEIFRVL